MPTSIRKNGRASKPTTTAKRKAHTNGNSPHSPRKKSITPLPHGTDEVEIQGIEFDEGDEPLETATVADAREYVGSLKFLKRNMIPFGMVTGIIAEPGKGKSAFVLYAIARVVMTACSWWDGTKGPRQPGYVLWCGTENDLAITLDRVDKWGIPDDKLLLPFNDPLTPFDLANEKHMERLHLLICQFQIQLVVIDSLRGGHDGDENNSRVGNVLKRLARIAEETGAAIVVVHHTGKLTADDNGGTEVSARSSRGSNAIIAMFRSLIGVDQPDSESPWCRVRVLKDNLGISPKPFGFRVTKKGLEFGDAPIRPQKKKGNQFDAAAEWLLGYMEVGKVYIAGDVIEAGEQYGHIKSKLSPAATQIGVVRERVYEDGKVTHWTWCLTPRDDV